MLRGLTMPYDAWKQRFADGLSFADRAVKQIGAIGAAIALVGVIVPPVGNSIKVITSWRFGAVGYVKYEVGSVRPSPGMSRTLLLRQPTEKGQLYLLRNGEREFGSVGWGDVVQAQSEIYFRAAGRCGEARNCASAPVVFVLQKGDCAIVIGRAYDDSGPDDPDPNAPPLGTVETRSQGLVAKSGGWLKVATTACGIFR
jgi:hypothetical protein